MVYLEECELIVRDYLGAGPIYVDKSDNNDGSMIIKKFSRSLVLNYITYVYSCNKTDIHFIHSLISSYIIWCNSTKLGSCNDHCYFLIFVKI